MSIILYPGPMHVGLLLLTGIASKGKLFCSSFDLLETFVNETKYCTFSGIDLMFQVDPCLLV